MIVLSFIIGVVFGSLFKDKILATVAKIKDRIL